MFNPADVNQMQRLQTALEDSRKRMAPHIETARQAWELYVGHKYGERIASRRKRRFVNLLAHAVDIYADRLTSSPPLVTVQPVPWSPNSRRLALAARKLEAVVNAQLRHEQVDRALALALVNALFGIGAIQVGLRANGETEYGGERVMKTGPYIAPILMEDLVIDMTARSIDQRAYVGHRYQRWLDEVQNDPSLDRQAVRNLEPSELFGTDPTTGNSRLSTLTAPGGHGREGCYADIVELWDVFLPREQLLLTLSADFARVLKTTPWTGPKRGPVKTLSLRRVPGNAMPRGPANDWCDMDQLFNDLFRKQAEQARRFKLLPVVQQGDEADAERFLKAADGMAVTAENPQAVVEQRFGGPDQNLLGFSTIVMEWFSKYAGNIDIMGGLSSQSDTLGQDQILNANAGKTVESISRELLAFAKDVLTDYARYCWEDPLESYPADLHVPGYGMLQTRLEPHERTADFFDLMLDVEPFSMQSQTPAARLAGMQQYLSQTVMPFLPYAQQQGYSLDFQELFRQQARLMGQPELERLVVQNGEPLDAATATVSSPASTAGKPNGQYTRTNVSAGGGTDTVAQAMQHMQPAGNR